MKSLLLAVSGLLVLAGASKATDKWCLMCPDRGDMSWAQAYLVGMDTLGQGMGSISIEYEIYYSDNDPSMDTITVRIIRDCNNDQALSEDSVYYMCAAENFNPDHWDPECSTYTHAYFHIIRNYLTWGKGIIEAYFGNTLLLSADFNFLDEGGYGEPEFEDIYL